jgi:hypothetical protein
MRLSAHFPPRSTVGLPDPGFAAALCLTVAVIHLEDQNWFAFAKEPSYVLAGYLVLEILGLLTAWRLLTDPRRSGWLFALGVGIGPFVGYLLSRGPGLPDYTSDKGAWGEPIGVVSLVVEGLLILISLIALANGKARIAQHRTNPATRQAA